MSAEHNKEVKDQPTQSGKSILFGYLAFIVGAILLMFLLKAIGG